MPSITSGRVLVTGANGYVATWVLKYLLERSFSVRGTIRSESKAAHLREHFKSYRDRLELVVIEDITKEGAFDTATDGVDAIMHVASPVNLHAEEPDEVIVPAVQGTLSILQTALKYRSTVKRVIITSSCAAVMTPPQAGLPPRVFDENDWNEWSVQHVREKGREANPMDKYRASKVLAERAAWEFYEREKSKLGGELRWDLVVLAPPYVFGPVIHEAPSLDQFGGTARDWYDHVIKGDLSGDALVKNGFEYVDVRDFAHAELLALITPQAGGERFIIRGGSFVWQDFVNAARRYSEKIPPGDPSYDPSKAVYPTKYNTKKARRILGIEFRSLEETTKDSLEDFKSRGWL
ncbi:D-lactaldehyde dehydrogenase [Pilatotrama ljubarskyi]|nr:D-lactaldehyde dehydrogenase [Pilatotrama ljubarskyi]